MHPIKHHFTARTLPENLIGTSPTPNSAGIHFRRPFPVQGMKNNADVGISSTPSSDGFPGDRRLVIAQTVDVCGSRLRVCRNSDGSLQKKSCLIDQKINRMESESEQEGILHADSKPSTPTDVKSNANGKRVKLRFKHSNKDLEAKFSLGSTVEVRSDEDGCLRSWYTATIVGSVGVGNFLVEFKCLKTHDGTNFLRYIANEENIRPYPPQILQSQRYEVLQEVDAWYNDGWCEGVISEVLDEWKYAFYFASSNEKIVCLHSQLRPHQNWLHGKWVLASQKESCHIRAEVNDKGIKLRIKLPPKKIEAKFSPGTTVEVKNDEDGYRGSWYTATVVRSVEAGKFLVEYKTLTTDDETEHLREVANEEDIRPYPPEMTQSQRYEVLREVDAWYNDGWWEGVISKVLDEWKYVVYFASSNEMIACQHSHLRLHQNWVCGKWVLSSPSICSLSRVPRSDCMQEKPSDVKLKATPSKRKHGINNCEGNKFRKGAMIEVKKIEQGYEGCWYSAFIVRSKRNGRFLVEYYALKTDGKKPVREEIDARSIRPWPPVVTVDNHYCLLEKVDAWYKSGWREGLISGVPVAAGKYMVFFETTHEEMEFDQVNLRRHLDWIDGKWIASDKGNRIWD